MAYKKIFDVIIVGGSYAGLAAGMALGRSLRQVLIIDSGDPCNKQTPHSHNFLTQDGKPPKEISLLARQQVEQYATIKFQQDLVVAGARMDKGFEVSVASGETFRAKKLVFATGIRDVMPSMDGFAACWGISVIHCPYCHGYEVRNERTGILANGDQGFDMSRHISNWTKDLTLFTNGVSSLTAEQSAKLGEHHIQVVDKEIERLEHNNGQLQHIIFRDATIFPLKALYGPRPFEQHCTIPATLGCELTEDGYIRVDAFQKTTVEGIYACGDNVTRMRTVANAISMGTITGIMTNRDLITEEF